MATPMYKQPQLIRLIVGFFFQSIPGAMLSPLLSLGLAAQHVDALLIGALASTASVAYMIALPNTPLLIRRLGEERTFRLALVLSAVSILGLVVSDSPVLWVGFFALLGFSAGLRFTLAESWLPAFATPETRGRSVGFFQSGLGAALFVGAGLLLVLGVAGFAPRLIIIGAEMVALSILWPLKAPAHPMLGADVRNERGHVVRQLLAMGPLVLGAALLGGLFESGLSIALPLYGLVVGMSPGLAAGLVTAMGLGRLAQCVFGALTDRFDWQRIVFGATVLLAVSALLLPLALWWSWVLMPLGIVWGCAGGGLYTLATIRNSAYWRGPRLVSASVMTQGAYMVGEALGPTLGGLALDLSPSLGLVVLVASAGMVGLLTLLFTPREAVRLVEAG